MIHLAISFHIVRRILGGSRYAIEPFGLQHYYGNTFLNIFQPFNFHFITGGTAERGVSKLAYFCIQQSSIFCLMCCPIRLLYRVVKDFVQKVLFSEILAVRLCMIRGRGINTVLNHCKSALDMPIVHKPTE